MGENNTKPPQIDQVQALLDATPEGGRVKCQECNGSVFVEGRIIGKIQGKIMSHPVLMCDRCKRILPIVITKETVVTPPQGQGH